MTIYEYGQHLASYSEPADIEELKKELQPLEVRTALVIEKYPLVSSSGKIHYRFGVVVEGGAKIIPLKYGTKADSLCRKIFGLESSSAPKLEKELQARLRLLQGIVAEQEVTSLTIQKKIEEIRELPSFKEKSLTDLEAKRTKKEAEIADLRLEILDLEQRKEWLAQAKEKTSFEERIAETKKEIGTERARLKGNPEYQRLEALKLLLKETTRTDRTSSPLVSEFIKLKNHPSLKKLKKLEKTLSELENWENSESPNFKPAIENIERSLGVKRENLRLKESALAINEETIAMKKAREGKGEGEFPFSPKTTSLPEQIAEYEERMDFYEDIFATLGSKSAEILNTMYETAKTKLTKFEERKAAITAEIGVINSEIARLAEKIASKPADDLIKLAKERSYQVDLKNSNESILRRLDTDIEQQKEIIARHEKRRAATPRAPVQKDTLRLAPPLKTALDLPSVSEEKDLERTESPGIIGTFLSGVVLSAFNLLVSISENWPVREKHREQTELFV